MPSPFSVPTNGEDLSEDLVISSGGWSARYARVLLIEEGGDDAVVLVDGNGDGAELELEYWHRGAERAWHGGSSSGYGPLETLPSFVAWNAGPFVAALGRADPGVSIALQYGGDIHHRHTNSHGIWGFVRPSESGDPHDLPALATDRRGDDL